MNVLLLYKYVNTVCVNWFHFDTTCWDDVVSFWFDFMAILGWGQLVSLKGFHLSAFVVFNLCYPPWPCSCMCRADVVWQVVWDFQFRVQSVRFNMLNCMWRKVSFHMHDSFNHPRNMLLDLGFWGHIIESIGHQMHVAYKDFRSYCAHHVIECSQPAFTKGQVSLIESTFFCHFSS